MLKPIQGNNLHPQKYHDMANNIIISSTSKADKYKELLPQIETLIAHEEDQIANLANVTAALKTTFNFFWVGFYLVREGSLILGPFQGDIACTRIRYRHGVCGTAWAKQATQIVEDVDRFPGHIACSSLSKSEIVIPIIKADIVVAVLDIDSDRLANFDTTDRLYLEMLAGQLASLF